MHARARAEPHATQGDRAEIARDRARSRETAWDGAVTCEIARDFTRNLQVVMYGKEGEIESDEDDDDKEEDFMKIALAAEDELLIAQVRLT